MNSITLTAAEGQSIRTLQQNITAIQANLEAVQRSIALLSSTLSEVMALPVVTRLCEMERMAAQQREEVAVHRSELQSHIEKMKMAFPFLSA